MPLRLLDGLLIVRLLGAESQLGLRHIRVEHVDARLPRRRCRSLALHGVKPFDGGIVSPVGSGGLIVDVYGVGDQPYRTGDMVDYRNIGGESQHELRLIGFVRRLAM